MATPFFFAHAGEAHDAVTTAAIYSIFSKWYTALPLFIVFLAVITRVTYWVSRKSKPTTYNVLLATLFIAGVAAYTTSASISVLSLSLGFAMALLQVLIGFSAPIQKNVKE